MQMTHVIINFRQHLKRRNFSAHTVKYYLNIIKQYVIWLDVPLEQATVEKVDAYIDYLHRKRMHPSSINLYLVIIRVFYDYLRYEERVDLTNPVKRNRRFRVPKPLPRSLRDQEVERLFGVIKGKRDIAMFKLMLRCGLRVEEVSNLRLATLISNDAGSLSSREREERGVSYTSAMMPMMCWLSICSSDLIIGLKSLFG